MQLILYSGTPLGLKRRESKKYFIYIKPEQTALNMNDGLTLLPSTQYMVKLDHNSYSQLPHPYSNCVVLDDNTLIVPRVVSF